MSLYRNLIKDSRVLMIASASGIALFSQHIPTQAFDSVFQRANQTATQQEAPKRLQLSGANVRSIGSVSSGRTIQTQYQQPQSADSRVKSLYGTGGTQAAQPTQPVRTPVRQSASTQYQSRTQPQARAPHTLPQNVMSRPVVPAQQPQAEPRTQQQQQQPVVQQTAGSRSNKRSFFDRLVGKIRGDSNIPDGPPQDPGMRYTPVSKAPRQAQPQSVAQQPGNKFIPPPVPGATTAPQAPPSTGKFVPPPVPGVDSKSLSGNSIVPPAVDGAETPRLFPTQAKPVKPVEHPLAKSEKPPMAPPASVQAPGFIPPMPGEELEPTPFRTATRSTQSVAPVAPENFPELKKLMEAPEEEKTVVKVVPEQEPITIEIREKSKTPLQARTLEVPKAERELPKMEIVLDSKPDEKQEASEEVKVVEVPEINTLDIPAPEALEVPEATASMSPAQTANRPPIGPAEDPLANPFPDDAKTPSVAESQSEATTPELMDDLSVEKQVVQDDMKAASAEASDSQEAPYTGLALEEDLFLKTKVPAPGEPKAEEMPALPELPALAETEPASENEVALAPQMPDLPLLPAPDVKQDVAAKEMPAPVPASPEESPIAKQEADQQDAAVVEKTDSIQKEKGEGTLTPSLQAPKLQAPMLPEKKTVEAPKVAEKPETSERKSPQSKMELIASRKGMSGLKGFCPVQLRDARDLVDVKDEFSATFHGKEYQFSTNEALQTFIAEPEKYAPASKGNDVIHLSLTGEELEGSLDHAVWYRGRLYLFSSAETMETFVAAPSSHLTSL